MRLIRGLVPEIHIALNDMLNGGMATNSLSPSHTDQAEYWNGRAGQVWAREADRLDHSFSEMTQIFVHHIGARLGKQVLEIGCGSGGLALQLARAVGHTGHVTAVDISRPMLDAARARSAATDLAGRAAIAWQEADASAAALPSAVDLVVSRFGVMFFTDPAAAFANIRTALRPGGRLTMLCWRPLADNPWAAIPRDVVVDLVGLPEPTLPGSPGPFAFSDPAFVEAVLARAGFTGITAKPVSAMMITGIASAGRSALDDAVDSATQIGPGASLLRGAEDDIKARARTVLRAVLERHVADDLVRLEAACWIYDASNPA